MTEPSPWSAPAWGKIILLGEHAVVHGHRALAGAIGLGVQCRARPCSGPSRLRVPAWDIDTRGDAHPVARPLAAILEAANRSNLDIEARTELPAAAGLGSSAALSVALARALRPELSGDALRRLANAGEQCFHEQPSGIDVALSSDGGIGVYQKQSGLTSLPCAPLQLVVSLSGLPRSTATMVAGVAQRMQRSQEVRASIEAIGALVQEAEPLLVRRELEALGALMNQCHTRLQEIGVSVDRLDTMVQCARRAGALGAKLSGAGGGGCIIALAPGKEERVKKALEDLGHQSFITTLGASAHT